MKTTLDLPDALFRRTKATAALAGESLRDFVISAIKARLQERPSGWRSVFGKASAAAVKEIDEVVEADLSRIDPRDWT